MGTRTVWIAMLGLICSGLSAPAQDAEAPPPPKVHLVETGPFEASVTLDAFVQSAGSQEIQLKPLDWTTFVVESAVDSGKLVKTGDALVKFERLAFDREMDHLRFELQAGKLSLNLAMIELNLLKKTNPLDLEAAERTATVASDEWDDFVKQGEALERQTVEESLKMAQDSLDGSKEELHQLEKMYKADDLTEETEEIILKRARREVERAQFMVKTAKVQHDRRLEQELPREKRQKEIAKDREALNLEKTRENLPVLFAQKSTEVSKLEHANLLLTERITRMQQDEQLLSLTSPIDGVVVYGQAEYGRWMTTEAMRSSLRPGGTISPHQIIMTIIPDQGASLWVDIPEKDIGTCQQGQVGELLPTEYPGASFPGHLKGLTRVFSKEGIFSGEVEIDVAREDARWRPLTTGMTGKVRIVLFSAKDALSVPTSAVFTDEENPNLRYVFVSDESAPPRRQTVEVGLSSATKTHIKSGLQPGSKILLNPPEDK